MSIDDPENRHEAPHVNDQMTALVRDISAYCERNPTRSGRPLALTTFGQEVVRDRNFVSRLMDGGQCFPNTERKVRLWMIANPVWEKRARRERTPAKPRQAATDKPSAKRGRKAKPEPGEPGRSNAA